MRKVPGVVDLDSSLLDPVDETDRDPGPRSRGAARRRPGRHHGDARGPGRRRRCVDVRGSRRPVPGVPARRRAVPQRSVGAGADRGAVAHARPGAAADVIKVGAGKATSKITRQSRERAVTITMNVSPGLLRVGDRRRAREDAQEARHAGRATPPSRSAAARRSARSGRRSCSRSSSRSSSCTSCSPRSSSRGCTR